MTALGINRIRLEFKGHSASSLLMTALGINRIRLEFKVNGRYIRGFIAPVLIESDWNLK